MTLPVMQNLTQLIGLNGNLPIVNKDAFAAIIANCLTSLSANAVVWKLDPQPFIGDTDRARIVLDVFSIMGDGWDERRRVYGLPGYPPNAYVTVMLGNRIVHVTVRAEAFDKSVEAAELVDQVRSNIFSDDNNAALNAINLAWVDAEAAVRMDYHVDERAVNCAVADFTFNGIAQHVSGIAIDGNVPGLGTGPTWIETVNTDNEIPGETS